MTLAYFSFIPADLSINTNTNTDNANKDDDVFSEQHENDNDVLENTILGIRNAEKLPKCLGVQRNERFGQDCKKLWTERKMCSTTNIPRALNDQKC